MFDIGALELLLIVVVAIIVIGPKDMPQALRMAGKWVGKIRRVSGQFRSGFDNLVREAEMEEMEKKWKEQNAKIMAETPEGEMGPLHEHEISGAADDSTAAKAESAEAGLADVSKPVDLMAGANREIPLAKGSQQKKPSVSEEASKSSAEPASVEPMLPLGKPDEG